MRRELVTIGDLGMWDRQTRRAAARHPVMWGLSAIGDMTPIQSTAVAMNNALLAHGFKQSDQPLYRAFQAAAGLGVDGFPGKDTIYQLDAVLSPMGIATAPVQHYDWLAGPGYDGVNAPTAAEWYGAAPPPSPQPSPAPTPPKPRPAPLVVPHAGHSGFFDAVIIAGIASAGYIAYRYYKRHHARRANPCARMYRRAA